LQFTIADEKLEELQVADYAYAITPPMLIPLSEPHEGSNLILREALLSQSLCFQNSRLSIRSYI